MSRTVKELVEAVLTEGNFDATESQVLSWLNTRHELMCARTKCYRRKIQIGPTVAEQNGYPLPPEVMEIREVQVQSSTTTPPGLGVPYGAGRHIDLAEGALHYIWLGGLYLNVGGGIFIRDESSQGQDLLALFPTPTEAGLGITVFAICRPEPLSLTVPAMVVGSEGIFRFASTSRVLTETEKATFIATGVLPAGVGIEAGVLSEVFEYQAPGSTFKTAPVVKDGTGAYHAVVTPLTVAGNWLWRAKGFSEAAGKGTLMWETPLEEAFVGTGLPALKIPPEFTDGLIDGAIATGLSRIEHRDDIASPHEQRFGQSCTELLAQVNRRYRGSGPALIRVQG